MADQEPSQRRHSDVLDAIYDQMAGKPERSAVANTLFRARALEQLDVPAEIDNQLPLVSRRSWLLLVGVALVVVGFLFWAALTPSRTTVAGAGRVVAANGVHTVAAGSNGRVVGKPAASGTVVGPGQAVAVLRGESGTSPVIAGIAGTVWQVLVTPGTQVAAGQPVATLLPPGSGRAVLLPLAEATAGPIRTGMAVALQPLAGAPAASGTDATGKVAAISAALPSDVASQRTALPLAAGNYVLVTVMLDQRLAPGAQVLGQVVLSQGSVLDRLRNQ